MTADTKVQILQPNLGLKITHSSAIIMHIARTNGLWPTEEETVEADMLREELKDLVSATTGLCYNGHLKSSQINQYIEKVRAPFLLQFCYYVHIY